MEYYLEAIKAAAEKADPHELKPMLDFYLEQATADYKGGALALDEFYDILNEYNYTLMSLNVINYT